MREWSLLYQGGPLMFILMALSLIGFVLFFERLFFLHKGQIKTVSFMAGIDNLVTKGRLLEALTVCEETPGPVAIVVKAALLNYGKEDARVRRAIESAALVEIPALERRIGTLGAIAKIAPLIGLLGTVIGLYQGFFAMHELGSYASVSGFSGVTAMALVTTATGLAIAAVGHLAHHFLYGRVRAIVHDMEYAANAAINVMTGQDVSSDPSQKA